MTLEQLVDLLRHEKFEALFRRMGWDNPGDLEPVPVPDSDLVPVPAADKRGVTAWVVACPGGIPQRSEQHRVVRQLKRFSRDQLVVFVAPDEHHWLWPEQRQSGVGYRLVEHAYPAGVPTDALLQRLHRASFTIDEEDSLTATSVLARVRQSFNADKVTASFYEDFQKHHAQFVAHVEGIPAVSDRQWYVSVLLNRLMFVYFIQQKGFMAGDQNYLRTRLDEVRRQHGPDQFYAFYRDFLLPLFHDGLGSPDQAYPSSEISQIIGDVPYVNGGIFEPHEIETDNDIDIPDQVFELLFDFFDGWRWHLDERITGAPNEINPDILGFIFEQYINYTESGQKEKGAYYTKPDVTGYMASVTVLPALVDRFVAAGMDDPCVLLPGSGDAYIHDSILYGVDKPPPEAPETGDREPPDDVSLSGERWCDITHRRERCAQLREALSDSGREWTIDDAVTQNLDLRDLMADYLSQLSTPDECDRAFDVLRSLTVCDPTVGSGAFLFAALEVLHPLYRTILGRAAELADKDADREPAACLAEARCHPSGQYWLLKTLCLNNLYGVDLMDEAPEIAKLRLFLKLAAQIDDKRHLEPLPDLDFNIKAGNLLVGIADEDDAATRLSAGQFDFGGEISKIAALGGKVAEAYDAFTDKQSRDTGASDHASDKQSLSRQLAEARGLADSLLHSKRADASGTTLDAWRTSHKPFHWFVEFPNVWRRGGFDVIIGNPPYIATKEIRGYRWVGYATQACPNLYAPCVERASTLLNDHGRMSMIVMHSLCYSKNFVALRDHLRLTFPGLWLSSYARIPAGLFPPWVRVRNSILIGARRAAQGLHTSSCRRWRTKSRPSLFDTVEYVQPPAPLCASQGRLLWPFVDSDAVAGAFAKLVTDNSPLSAVTTKTSGSSIAFKRTAHYMLGVSAEPAPTRGGQAKTARPGYLRFADSDTRDVALLALAGRWGYLWWLIFGDELNVTTQVLTAFPAGAAKLLDGTLCNTSVPNGKQRLLDLAAALKSEMPKHVAWKANAGVDVGRYDLLACRHITDEADLLLSQLWGIEEGFEPAGALRDRATFGSK